MSFAAAAFASQSDRFDIAGEKELKKVPSPPQKRLTSLGFYATINKKETVPMTVSFGNMARFPPLLIESSTENIEGKYLQKLCKGICLHTNCEKETCAGQRINDPPNW